MTIDPTTLPDGTVVQCEPSEMGPHLIHVGCLKPTRVFVPVSEGMTYADAEAALADAGAWVEVQDWGVVPDGARLRNEWVRGRGGDRTYIHRDDLPPTDPDAELVEVIEKSVPIGSWDGREVLRRLRAEGFDVTHEAKS